MSGRSRAVVAAAVLAACLASVGPAVAAPDDVTIDGETMTYPGPGDGGEVQDPGASGGKALYMKSSSWATKTVTTTRPTDYLFVKAKGQVCNGDPIVTVKVGSKELYSGTFGNGAYKEPGVRVSLPAGQHVVQVRMANDDHLEVAGQWICDRNAYLDRITLVAAPFSPSGWRNQPLPASTPVAANSAQMVADIQRQIDAGAADPNRPGTWISTGATATIYTVGPDQPLVNVVHSGHDPSLTQQWTGVPLPDDAKPSDPPWNPTLSKYGDANLVVWQPSTDTLWEFFHLRRNDPANPTGWAADFGGRMQNASQFEGQFENPPGSQFGSSATSISLLTGMRIAEVQRGAADAVNGVIEHAISMTVTGTEGYDGWCWPAHRTDPQHWSRSAAAIPAGTRFRLPASFNLGTWTQTHPMHPFALMVARTVQKYGVVVSDSGQGIGFGVEDPAPTGTDPFYANGQPRADGPFAGQWPDEGGVLHNFPWQHLEALAQPTGTGQGCHDDPDVRPPNDN